MKTRICILFIAMAVMAVPTFGQFYHEREIDQVDDGGGGSYDLGTYMENPCTAVQDWVYVDYNVFLEQQQLQTASGAQRFFFNEQTSMGSAAYAASGSSKDDVAYGTAFTLRKYHKVNTYDQFHVVTVIDFYPSTKETVVSVETACGNGMPDSAQ